MQSRDNLPDLNIVRATRLLSHQKGLSSPDSSLRLLTRKEVQRILTERQFVPLAFERACLITSLGRNPFALRRPARVGLQMVLAWH